MSEQLGWGQSFGGTLSWIEGDETGSGPVSVGISTHPVPCPTPSCAPELQPRTEVVVMERLVGEAPNGIWSVTEVYDPALPLRLPLSAGQTVVSGQDLVVPLQVPDGFEAHVGYTYLTVDCGGGPFPHVVEPQVDPNAIRFSVADMSFETSCEPGQAASVGGSMDENGADLNQPLDGYVYVALVARGASVDDPFAPVSPPQGADAALSIAAVAVRFVPVGTSPEVQAAPDVVRVECGQGGTTLDTAAVQPQLDGVHLEIPDGGTSAAIEIRGFSMATTLSTGLNVVTELVPGDYEVRCSGDQGPWQTLHVVDPQGVYNSPDLSSTCSSGTGSAAVLTDVVGGQGDPVDLAKAHLKGLRDGDVVERAGYPGAADPTVRVTRAGEVIASFHFISDGQGGWLQDSSPACSDAGLSWSDSNLYDPDQYPRGVFEWCPDLGDLPEAGTNWAERAPAVALRFVEAYEGDDAATLAQLTDASVPADAVWPIAVAPGTAPKVIGVSAAGGTLVRFGCGPDVDAYSFAITIDDGTNSASADFTLYLVLRSDGYKVWGAY